MSKCIDSATGVTTEIKWCYVKIKFRIYEAYYKKAGGAPVKTKLVEPYYSMGGLLIPLLR